MRRFVVLGILCVSVFWSFGQESSSLNDTIQLDEIVSYGSLRKYQSGSRIEKIPTILFTLQQDADLEQILSRSFPIAFKTDAGGLSTIRIRGTGPNHTSIRFGGIDINSLSLGHSNFSNVPVYLFDHIGVQFGSASTVNGSGSIGGAVYLGLNRNWIKGFKADLRISHGAFGEQFYGTKLFAGNGNFESVTRAYYYYKTNQFPFINTAYRDFENSVFSLKDRQKNANIEKYGLLQELNYQFSENHFIFIDIWLERDWWLAQPSMQNNLADPVPHEPYTDEHARIWTGYRKANQPFKFEIGGGYVWDNAVNNGLESDTIRTRRYIFEAFIEHDFSRAASYKVGLNMTRILPEVYAYVETMKQEDRLDFYASYYQRLLDKLTVTVNLRQGMVSNFDVPFTPSIGLNYRAVSKDNYVLMLSGNVARSYRVPTFNDRFWLPGGNPDLKPEKGMSYELGMSWNYCSPEVSGNFSLNAFLMNVDNWILWKNGGSYWYAANVQQVQSKGIELKTDWNYRFLGQKSSSGLSYSFTSAERVKSLNSSDPLHRQLEYVPLHAATGFTTWTFNDFQLNVEGRYTYKQYTDGGNTNILDDYFLLNTSVVYQLQMSKIHKINLVGSVNNLLNTSYQSSWGYAMPGISYRLSVIYAFK